MGYPVSFEYTGVVEIDNILRAVENAASYYHNVNDWNDGGSWESVDVSPREEIQRVADLAAEKIKGILK